MSTLKDRPMGQVRYNPTMIKRKPRHIFERIYWALCPSKVKYDRVYMPVYPGHPDYNNAFYSAEGIACERPFLIYKE